jgi:hypothetical protein
MARPKVMDWRATMRKRVDRVSLAEAAQGSAGVRTRDAGQAAAIGSRERAA